MNNGKGDKRRPMAISDRQLDINWQRAFTKNIHAMCAKLHDEVDQAFTHKSSISQIEIDGYAND